MHVLGIGLEREAARGHGFVLRDDRSDWQPVELRANDPAAACVFYTEYVDLQAPTDIPYPQKFGSDTHFYFFSLANFGYLQARVIALSPICALQPSTTAGSTSMPGEPMKYPTKVCAGSSNNS